MPRIEVSEDRGKTVIDSFRHNKKNGLNGRMISRAIHKRFHASDTAMFRIVYDVMRSRVGQWFDVDPKDPPAPA